MAEMRRAMALASDEVGVLSRGIGGGLRAALNDLAMDGAKLSDVLRGIGQGIAGKVFGVATRPVTDALCISAFAVIRRQSEFVGGTT